MTSLLLDQLRPARGDIARLLGVLLAGAVPTFASGLVVSRSLDTGFLVGRPDVGLAWLVVLAFLGIGGAYASAASLPYMARVAEPFRDRLATLAVRHGLARVVYDDTARDVSGALAVRSTEHIEGVRSLVIALLRSALGTTITVAVALAGLATLVPLVAVIVLTFLAVGLAGYLVVLNHLVRGQRAMLVAEERVGEASRRLLAAHRDVIAFGAASWALVPALSEVDAAARAGRRVALLGCLRSLISSVSIALPMVALLGLAPWLTTHTQLTTGDLIGGVVYLMQGLAPAVGFLASGGTGWLVQLALLSERLGSDIQVKPQGGAAAQPARLRGNGAVVADGPLHLRAHGLTFAYSPQARPVLEDVTLDLPAGAHVVFVGLSGVGKSTLAALLAGVRRPQRGTVTLGGVDLDRWSESTLRQTVAYVPQESYVFAGTVLENLVLPQHG